MEPIFTFSHPTSIIIAGPSGSGKTCFLVRALKTSLFQPPPTRIIWFYKEWQKAYADVKLYDDSIEFQEGIVPSYLSSLSSDERNMVIIDDLMSNAAQSKDVSKIFTQESHHRNLTVVLLVQNLFCQGKEMRNISLNTHYMVLYKNPRDKSQIRFLSHQIFPENPKFLPNVFHNATEQPHSYLLIDLHPETEEQYRVLTKIFPEEQIRFYVPENYKSPQNG